jgi:erythronate-4-phosphate dehydrogenase
MKIVADQDIFQVAEYFSTHGKLVLMPGREITRKHVSDVDVLLVRTITDVSSELLDNTSVKFVASASAGFDHIDTAYLNKQGIRYVYAPGCNAAGVVDYFFAAMAWLHRGSNVSWFDKSVGVIGCGNVGSRLVTRLNKLGISCLIHDPFLPLEHEHSSKLVSLDEALSCEIATVHTSLTKSGTHPTFHLLGSEQLQQLSDNAVLVNASRGEVVDSDALKIVLKERPDLSAVLDVWEGEPDISQELLELSTIGTPHIAGYSENGKRRATEMVYSAFCEFAGLHPQSADSETRPLKALLSEEALDENWVSSLLLQAYPINQDFLPRPVSAQAFERLRNEYRFRKEFSDYSLSSKTQTPEQRRLGLALGFAE